MAGNNSKKTDAKNKVPRMAYAKTAKIIIPAILMVLMVATLIVLPSSAFAQTAITKENDFPESTFYSNSSFKKPAIYKTIKEGIREGTWDDKHPVRLAGKGELNAEGKGAVRLKGRTDSINGGIVSISGKGILTVKDLSGDIDTKITGYAGSVKLKNGLWLYYGFNGEAEIKGSGFIINVSGEDIKIHAVARAIVFLAGEGTYSVEKLDKNQEQ